MYKTVFGSIKKILELKKLEEPMYYIAAPFFNEAQLHLVRCIEQVFDQEGVLAFSPRLQHGEKPEPIKSRDQARQVFDENYHAIVACTSMLAVVDWMNKAGESIRSVTERTLYTPEGREFDHVSGPLNLPDTGTVWEMGAAFALQRPVIMYTQRPRTAKLNIMLTESCRGMVAFGLADLQGALQGEPLQQWEGRYT